MVQQSKNQTYTTPPKRTLDIFKTIPFEAMFLIGVSKPDLGQDIAGTYDEGAADGEEDADVFVAHIGGLVQNRDRNAQRYGGASR